MAGLKFDKTITLGDLCIAIGIVVPLIIFGANVKFQLDADDKQIVALMQNQQQFQSSLQAEKDARLAYQADSDRQLTEMRTILNDRLNVKP